MSTTSRVVSARSPTREVIQNDEEMEDEGEPKSSATRRRRVRKQRGPPPVSWEEHEANMDQIITYLPPSFAQCRPDFTNRMTYTSLENENMESMILRVRGCLERWAQ